MTTSAEVVLPAINEHCIFKYNGISIRVCIIRTCIIADWQTVLFYNSQNCIIFSMLAPSWPKSHHEV